jgi:hypothetical protein
MMAGETRDTSGLDIAAGRQPADEEVFRRYPPAQFTVAGQTIAFPVQRIQESGSNRIINRERPYRDGAKLDDTGSTAKQWVLEAIFENTIRGLDSINGGAALYPDVLNDLIFLFDVHETGDLVVPTVGKKRVRATSYQRTESFEARDQAIVTFIFTEDNEDSVDFRSITAPTGAASARRLAETTSFSAQSVGAWDESFENVQEGGENLESASNGPGSVSQDVFTSATQVQGGSIRADQLFKNPARAGRSIMLDPASSSVERNLSQIRDLAARSKNESRGGRPRLIEIVFNSPTSLFRVSGVVHQSFDDLIDVNPTLDPFYIPAFAPVKVFATEELLHGAGASTA